MYSLATPRARTRIHFFAISSTILFSSIIVPRDCSLPEPSKYFPHRGRMISGAPFTKTPEKSPLTSACENLFSLVNRVSCVFAMLISGVSSLHTNSKRAFSVALPPTALPCDICAELLPSTDILVRRFNSLGRALYFLYVFP